MKDNTLEAIRKQLAYYRHLGQQTLEQVPEDKLFWEAGAGGNSIATIVKHLWGNMRSRFTDFLDSDGEKEWREREKEFDNDLGSKEVVLEKYKEGWDCVFGAIDPLTGADMDRIVYIRNEGHSVAEAILRQSNHYAYHVGQMVFLGKTALGDEWRSLSIPRGGSAAFNAGKFAQEKHRAHFSDSLINPEDDK